MIAGTESSRDTLWQRFAVAIPYIWLLIFFLAPFVIILKISTADPIIGQPPFTPMFDDDGSFIATLESFKFLLTDKLYGITYLRSVIMAASATILCLLLGFPMAYGIARSAPATGKESGNRRLHRCSMTTGRSSPHWRASSFC